VLIAGNLSAVGWVLSVVSGIDYLPALIIATVVIVTYTIAGGLYSAIWTDFVQVYAALIGFVAAAVSLWRDYFWPHAKAVFDSAELSDYSKRVRRVARWLLENRPAEVSREEVRRRALGQQRRLCPRRRRALPRHALRAARADLRAGRAVAGGAHWRARLASHRRPPP